MRKKTDNTVIPKSCLMCEELINERGECVNCGASYSGYRAKIRKKNEKNSFSFEDVSKARYSKEVRK